MLTEYLLCAWLAARSSSWIVLCHSHYHLLIVGMNAPCWGQEGVSIETEEPPAFAGLVTGELHLHQAGLPALP